MRIDQTQLAAAVAKEVTKAILPRAIALALIAVALAAALWFLFGRGTP